MNWKAILLALLLFPAAAFAGTDYTCLKRCLGMGTLHADCLVKCGYDNDPTTQERAALMNKGCFKGCVKDRGEAVACLPQCSDIIALTKKKRVTIYTQDQKNNVLDAPTPLSGDMVLPPIAPPMHHVKPPVNEHTDPVCMQGCTRGKLVYGLCKERCAE